MPEKIFLLCIKLCISFSEKEFKVIANGRHHQIEDSATGLFCFAFLRPQPELVMPLKAIFSVSSQGYSGKASKLSSDFRPFSSSL